MPSEWRVAFLTNLIPPYHIPLFTLLSRHYHLFRLFISTPMEPNRPWVPDWHGLDVTVQKGITLRRSWRHPRGFVESTAVHFPLDTFGQLGSFRPHVVISVEMGFRTLLAYLYARLNRRCRLLIWTEVTDVTERGRGPSRQFLRRFLVKRAHGFLAVGEGGVRYIQRLGANPATVFKLSYSTDLSTFAFIPLERHGAVATRLLFCGQLIQRKGLLGFLHTLTSWATVHPEFSVEFTIVGTGPERAALAEMPMRPNVKLIFIGGLQYRELPEIYADSGIFVLPTLADTWAVAVNEALASGLPVLGSVYSQAVEEMVGDGENGWTFRADQPEEMYNALERALTTSIPELNAMRQCARARALAVTAEAAAAAFDDALRTVMEGTTA
jgi:glycosyltransferase involved in cell wall biosynthesis